VVELGLQLPAAYLFRRGWTKYILRKAMQPFLPDEVVWRREKMGFPFPLRSFLEQHRAQLAAYLPKLARTGVAGGALDYDGMVRSDPQKLWRLCSTALWLDNL
jgi:asparagine synthase (glutamine-hydrolysing)